MSKKEVVKSAPKKVVAPVVKPVKKVVKKRKVIESSVSLISFSIKATIPVMTFGNIQPEVVVVAKTIEEATAYALPIIEGLFAKYVEAPRDGSPKPAFIPKSNVTVTEKIVGQNSPAGAVSSTPKPESFVHSTSKSVENKKDNVEEFNKSLDATADQAPGFVKSPALMKAEGAIAAAMSNDALDMIEQQIKDSTKLTDLEKPVAFTTLLKKRKEFSK